MASYDILGLGVSAVDDILFVESFPQPDTKAQVMRSERRVGGLTAVALAAAARLGAACAYAGVLGHDDISTFVETTLRAEGIDTALVVRRDDAQPVHATIILDASTSSRTILYEIRGRTGADETRPDPAVLQSARVLFVDDHGIPGSIRAVQIAREAGIPVVGDFERNHWARFDELFALIDHVLVGQQFARRYTATTDPAASVLRLWTPARAVVIVTCGDQGCWYTTDGVTVEHMPAFPVQAIDTTGCGDVFHGAYAAALAWGWSMEARVRFASAAGAIKASRGGGIAGIPSRAEVEVLAGITKIPPSV